MNRKKTKFVTACILTVILIFSTSCRSVQVYGFVSSDPNALDLVRTKAGAVVVQGGKETALPKDGRWISDDMWEKILKGVRFGKD